MVDPKEPGAPPDEHEPDEGPPNVSDEPDTVENIEAPPKSIENDNLEAIETVGEVGMAKPMAALDIVPEVENSPLR